MSPSSSNARNWARCIACAAAIVSIGAFGPARAQAPEKIEIRPVEITYRVALPPPAEGDVSRLSRSARVAPVVEGGVTTGFRVSAVRAGQIWDRAGWQDGDILRAVNGEPVDSPVRALALYERLKTADRVRVLIERDGHPLTLNYVIDRDGAAAPDVAPRPAPVARSEAPKRSGVEWIRAMGDGTYTVERAGLDAVLDDPVKLSRSARVVPAREDGAFVGIRIYGIRPSSLMADLGFRNGDLVRRINGLEVATPQQVMTAYGTLRQADEITVSLFRGGAPMTLRYTLVGEPAAPAAPKGR